MMFRLLFVVVLFLSFPLSASASSVEWRFQSDSDADGLPDEWERDFYGLNMLPDEDPDDDGLSNLQEYQFRTRPDSSDTDGDLLIDSFEISSDRHPLIPDYKVIATPGGGCAIEDRGLLCWGDDTKLYDVPEATSMGIWGDPGFSSTGVNMCYAIGEQVVCEGLPVPLDAYDVDDAGQWEWRRFLAFGGVVGISGFGVGVCVHAEDTRQNLICIAEKSLRATNRQVDNSTSNQFYSIPELEFLFGSPSQTHENDLYIRHKGSVPGLLTVLSTAETVCVVVNKTTTESSASVRCANEQLTQVYAAGSDVVSRGGTWEHVFSEFDDTHFSHAFMHRGAVCLLSTRDALTCVDKDGELSEAPPPSYDSWYPALKRQIAEFPGRIDDIRVQGSSVPDEIFSSVCIISTAQGPNVQRDNSSVCPTPNQSQWDINLSLLNYPASSSAGVINGGWRYGENECRFGDAGVDGCGFDLDYLILDADEDGCNLQGGLDAFPGDPTECTDTDNDGVGDNSDPFPNDASESFDTDGDGVGNNADTDDDGDGVDDASDAFPLDGTESLDTDGDGVGNNADTDDDGDGVDDEFDAFPLDISESLDSDGDGIGNNADRDDAGDGVYDRFDAYPLDATESEDTDGDGVGNNADPDDDGDGSADEIDACPQEVSGSSDTDADGCSDNLDAFPLDASESFDTDGDGVGNNTDVDDDGDGLDDIHDPFPLDPAASIDTDRDGAPDYWNPSASRAQIAESPLFLDAFRFDSSESRDTDGDGVGNNADVDDDGDGILDSEDVFPTQVLAREFDTGVIFSFDRPGFDASQVDSYELGCGRRTYRVSGGVDVEQPVNSRLTSSLSFNEEHEILRLSSVFVDIDAQYRGGVEITLTSPSGTSQILKERDDDERPDIFGNFCDQYDLLSGCNFDDPIFFASYGSFDVFRGESGKGDWSLTVSNRDAGATVFNRWSMSYEIQREWPIRVTGNQSPLRLNSTESARCEINALSNGEVVDTVTRFVSPGNYGTSDIDNDGVFDPDDALPYDPAEYEDTDGDGIGNNADTDDDGDGVEDASDVFPLDGTESLDTDGDGVGNNADTDDDGDGVDDASDVFPLDGTESVDTDGDGIGNNADADDDGDGVEDASDVFPLDGTESFDTDADGIGNNADTDDDGDGIPDVSDALPLDASESVDTDGDGVGNNTDTDDDGDGVLDSDDLFPLDEVESLDTDNDGVGNNADLDDDGDDIPDVFDAFPLDLAASIDTDGDGAPDAWNPSASREDIAASSLELDALPANPSETRDTDRDGIGNNADFDDDNDGILDASDVFPTGVSAEVTDRSAIFSFDAPGYNAERVDIYEAACYVGTKLQGTPKLATREVNENLPASGPLTSTLSTQEMVGAPMVHVDISTENRGDIRISITSPSGLTVLLKDYTSDTDDDIVGYFTNFSDDPNVVMPPNAIDAAESLEALDGGMIAGQWELRVTNRNGFFNPSKLNSWKIAYAGRGEAWSNVYGEESPLEVPNLKKNDEYTCEVRAQTDGATIDSVWQTVVPGYENYDRDRDGITDPNDDFPNDPAESIDTDGDGIGNNADTDDDNDGVIDSLDALPLSDVASIDTDGDGSPDRWNVGVSPAQIALSGLVLDAYPLDPTEMADADNDGIPDNADTDDDNDGILDDEEYFPAGVTVTTTDSAAIFSFELGGLYASSYKALCTMTSRYSATVEPAQPFDEYNYIVSQLNFPHDVTIDGDEMYVSVDISHASRGDIQLVLESPSGDEAFLKFSDNDSRDDLVGTYPTTLSPAEGLSYFHGENAQGNWKLYVEDWEWGEAGTLNAWGIALGDSSSQFSVSGTDSPLVLSGLANGQTYDCEVRAKNAGGSLLDRVVVSAVTVAETALDTDGDGVSDVVDSFPFDGTESVDTDGDGVGNNADTDDDGDGVDDASDAFPLDGTESVDTDGDGVGNNADTDDDGDGIDDVSDAFPLDPAESIDTDGDGIDDLYDPTPFDFTDVTPLLAEFSEAFGGAVIEGEGNFRFPSTAANWAGFINTNSAIYPFIFEYGGRLTFNASIPGGGTADVRFRFERSAIYPDYEPAFSTETVSVTGSISTSYSIDIPAQGSNTFSSLLLYLDTKDVVVSVTDILVMAKQPPAASDSDGDGVVDVEDAFPTDASETLDTDGDGVGNNADTDDDGDGYPDLAEISSGTDPLDPSSFPESLEDQIRGLPIWFYYITNQPGDLANP